MLPPQSSGRWVARLSPATPSRALARPLTRVLPGRSTEFGVGWVPVPPAMCPPSSHAHAHVTSPSTFRPTWYPPRRILHIYYKRSPWYPSPSFVSFVSIRIRHAPSVYVGLKQLCRQGCSLTRRPTITVYAMPVAAHGAQSEPGGAWSAALWTRDTWPPLRGASAGHCGLLPYLYPARPYRRGLRLGE